MIEQWIIGKTMMHTARGNNEKTSKQIITIGFCRIVGQGHKMRVVSQTNLGSLEPITRSSIDGILFQGYIWDFVSKRVASRHVVQ